MKSILLVCGAGMSTSLLVKKMQEADINNEYNIKCSDTVSAQIFMAECDIFLLAPHISYMKDEFQLQCQKKDIPFMVINSIDYTKMDGISVLKKVRQALENQNRDRLFKVILLHASTGAMTNLIVLDINRKKMNQEKDWTIESCEIENFEDDGLTDIILIEPQICYEESVIRRKMINPSTIIHIPPRSLYATFDGRKILDYIHKLYESNKI